MLPGAWYGITRQMKSRSQRPRWPAVCRGLKQVYRQGYRAFDAARSEPSTEYLHEWRKQAKYLWHQVQLLEAVHAIHGLERLRFTSPHPIGFRDDLLGALADLPKLAEHVHLPLQSGSDRILKAMHRPYTAEKYRALVERIRKTRVEMAITTDIIVGFPGEDDDDYQQTRKFVEEIQFDNAFVFRYSTRSETPAADLPQISEEVKEERNQDLLRVVDVSALRANERYLGRDVEILCEGPSRTNAARLMGRTRANG